MSEETNNMMHFNDWTSLEEYTKEHYPQLKEDIEFNEMWIQTLGPIIQKRKQLGLSQRDIARMIGMPQSTIARIESCKTIPNAETLYKLVNALGMTIIVK